MSYLKAIAKTKEENKKNNKKKDSVDWNKNAMDYISKVDGLFMQTKGVEKMYQTNTTKNDMVNHPPHYNQHGIECIDAIQACTGDGFKSYLQGNILKYLWRYDYKNGVEDLKKAQWYLAKLIEIKDGKD
tara:strand:+ start:852 stop:1238 length:387 start_codon:yes stop_codon:yes gene_type:complete